MSPKLPVYRSIDLVKLVEKAGFVFSRQTGSHMIFYHSKGLRVIVPNHSNKDLHPKIVKDTLALIEKSR